MINKNNYLYRKRLRILNNNIYILNNNTYYNYVLIIQIILFFTQNKLIQLLLI